MKATILTAVFCSMISNVVFAKTHTGIVVGRYNHALEVKESCFRTVMIRADANTIIDLGETRLPASLENDQTARLLSMRFGERVAVDYRRVHGLLIATKIIRYDAED